MKSLYRNLFFCCLALSVVLCSGWGFLVHRTINQLAIYQLPKSLQPFFYAYKDSIVKQSIRPDQRRNSDPTEATKHFIDLEVFGDSAAWKMPHTWDEAVRKYSSDTLIKYGYVPYWIVITKNKLTEAFKSGNKDSILFYATDIGHYIGDVNVPLHTSVYYDGQSTNQRGIHALWESTVPELELTHYDLSSKHKAKYLKQPEEAVWKAVVHAHSLLPKLWQEEKEASKDFTDSTKYRMQKMYGRDVKGYTTAFARAYNKRVGHMINDQLIRSANMIADFWYTAWVDAGRPKLSITGINNLESRIKKERKAFKKNELIEKELLISKEEVVVDPSATQ